MLMVLPDSKKRSALTLLTRSELDPRLGRVVERLLGRRVDPKAGRGKGDRLIEPAARLDLLALAKVQAAEV